MKIKNTILTRTVASATARVKRAATTRAILCKDGRRFFRWAVPIVIASLLGFPAHRTVEAAVDAPVETRVAHPTPPSRLDVYGKSYDLGTLENPVRARVLEQWKTDPARAMETYTAAVRAGRKVYFQNCFQCHGDQVDGKGMFVAAQNPRPANLRKPMHYAMMDEANFFWRITTGGAGLPKEAAPWNSAMPAAHNLLSEEDVWNFIIFLYDRVGQVPRLRDEDAATAQAALNAEVRAKRAASVGKELYEFRCSVCHGEQGKGDGPAADFLYPAPRDFTLGLFKYKTSPAKVQQPTDDDLFRTIKRGLPGTGMPAWGPFLDDDQIRSLIPVVKGFDTVGVWAPEDAEDEDFDEETGHYLKTDFVRITALEPVVGQIAPSEESIAQGKKAFEKNCSPCHGEEGRGNPAVEKQLRDDWGKRIWPRDLTKPWTWRVSNVPDDAEETIRKIFTRFSVGIPGSRMPQQSSGISQELRWHIANYVFTLRNTTPPVAESPVIRGVAVNGPLPESVDDIAWETAPSTTLLMFPNLIKGNRLFKPLNDAVSVRVLYNDNAIAFLLEVDDRTYSRPGDPDAEKIQDRKLELHSDAFAIQFPKRDAFVAASKVEKPMLGHGDPVHSTTIWYWNAGSVEPQRASYSMILDAAGSDEKLRPRQEDTSLGAFGEWTNGRWRVLMKRSRNGGENGDVTFSEDKFIPVSFADWDGSNGEVGSKHSLTSWYWLLLPSPENSP
ncbi:MAG: c-type cytochrome [Alphaproteobacteria bacterium]